jgi:hypothetical protein
MPTFLRINNGTDTEAEANCEQSINQSSLSHISTAGDSRGKYRSDCYIDSAVNGCFERTFSLALGLGRNRVSLRDIVASENHRRMLGMLLPAERRRLNDAIQLERYHLERTLARSRRDTKAFRVEYEIANHLTQSALIEQLPVELLASIFSFIPEEQNQKFDTLMKTCRRWKEIVSSFWAPLKLATWTSLDEVKATLEGANGLLSVTIDPSMDFANPPIGSLESERYAALMLAISTSISRWKTLDILSLPDPHETTGPSWEQNHPIDPVPMEHLRSLSIPVRHDSSRLLDRLLPSIGATTSDLLTDMHIYSVQAISYLAQPHCAQIFNHLTTFRCLLPRMDNIIDILPHFRTLENLEVSGVQFSTYASPVELPLTQTLRQMSLKNSSIDWMDQCRFHKLEKCFIMSPLDPSNFSSVDLPLCMELHFEGPQIDVVQRFHPSTASVLTIRCSQWSKLGGNIQIRHLYATVPTPRVLLETLHLHLTCSGRLLLEMLRLFPILKRLALNLERPSLPGRNFWRQFLLESNCEEERLQFCPSLESVRLRYRRWFRPGESNDLHTLVAIVRSRSQKKSGKEFELWVQKGPPEQGEDKVDTEPSSATLCSLDFLRPFNGLHPPIALMEESINISLKTLISTDVAITHPGAIEHLSPLVYSSLFRWLRAFTLRARSDQKILFDVLPHFEHLEELFVSELIPPSGLSYAHLPLLRTLKRMYLGETCLLWMEGCVFGKLEYCRFDKIMDDDRGKVQFVRMPACKDVLLPPNSVQLLDPIDLPVLDRLHFSMPSGANGWGSAGETPWQRQFRAPKDHSRSQKLWIPQLDGSSKLRSGLEVLEVRWNGKTSKDGVVGALAALIKRANVDKDSDPDRTRYIPGSSDHCSDDSSDGRPKLEQLHLKLNSTPKPLRYAIIHDCRQLIKKKRKLLQSCQIWWEEEEWDQDASMELIWQPVFNEPQTTAHPPKKLVDSIQARLEPQISKSTYTATQIDTLSIWDDFIPRSRKSGRQGAKHKEKEWQVCGRSTPGSRTGTIERRDSTGAVQYQDVTKGRHAKGIRPARGCTSKLANSRPGRPNPECVEEAIKLSLKTRVSANVAIIHPEANIKLGSSLLFRRLWVYRPPVLSDQSIVFDVLPRFEHLEELFVSKLIPPSPLSYAHLPLLHTLKQMYLGETCLLWMEGCVFGKLEYCRFDKIMDDDRSKVQFVRMPACKGILLPPNSVQLLDPIDLPVLERLHLSTPSGANGWESAGETPWQRQFRAPKNRARLQKLCMPKLNGSSRLKSDLKVLEVRWNWKASKDGVAGVLAALINRADVGKDSHPDRTRCIPGSSDHCNDDSSDCRPKLEKLHLKLNSTPKSLRYAIIHGCHQLIKRKRKLLQSCQIWWEEEEWNQEASMELIWQPVFNEPQTIARPPKKPVDSIQARLEPRVSKSRCTSTYVDELSIWDDFTPRSRKSGRQREKRKEMKWRVCRKSIPGYHAGAMEPGDSAGDQGVAKGTQGLPGRVIHPNAGILRPKYKMGHNIQKRLPPVQRSQAPHAPSQPINSRLGALESVRDIMSDSWRREREVIRRLISN